MRMSIRGHISTIGDSVTCSLLTKLRLTSKPWYSTLHLNSPLSHWLASATVSMEAIDVLRLNLTCLTNLWATVVLTRKSSLFQLNCMDFATSVQLLKLPFTLTTQVRENSCFSCKELLWLTSNESIHILTKLLIFISLTINVETFLLELMLSIVDFIASS